jgi:hypothetical protein
MATTPTLGSIKIVDALPLAQRTATVNGDMFQAYHISHDPVTDSWIGWFKEAGVFVNQTAGSGNNPGVNQFTIKLQGRVDSSHGWADLSMTPIAVTANSAAAYYALVAGPILPELRVVATESGTADATFEVHVVLQAD